MEVSKSLLITLLLAFVAQLQFMYGNKLLFVIDTIVCIANAYIAVQNEKKLVERIKKLEDKTK